MPSAVKVVLWNLLALGGIFALFELAARTLLASNNPLAIRPSYNLIHRPSAFQRFVAQPNQRILRLDAKGRPDPAAPTWRINAWGFRGEDFPLAKPKGEIRIVFLGGSHVFDLNCHDVDDCPGYPALVERRLALQTELRVRVINAGLPGQDARSFPSQLSLDLPRLKPDIVVIASIWNDLKWMTRLGPEDRLSATLPAGARNPLVERAGILDDWLGWSAFFRKGRDFFWQRHLRLDEVALEGRAVVETLSGDFDPGFAHYLTILRASVAIARSLGATPVLVLEERLVASDNDASERARIAFSMVGVEHPRLVELFARADLEIEKLAAEEAVPLFDFNPALKSSRAQIFADHVHLTPAGSRVLAEHYASSLRELLTSEVGQP